MRKEQKHLDGKIKDFLSSYFPSLRRRTIGILSSGWQIPLDVGNSKKCSTNLWEGWGFLIFLRWQNGKREKTSLAAGYTCVILDCFFCTRCGPRKERSQNKAKYAASNNYEKESQAWISLCPDTVTVGTCNHGNHSVSERTGGWGWGEGFTIYYYGRDTPFLFLGVPPKPTRFAMPAARRKTSLNARDWWKGKELFI